MLDLINHEEFTRFLNNNEDRVIVYVCSEFDCWLRRVAHTKVISSSTMAFYGDEFITINYCDDYFVVHCSNKDYYLYGKKDR